MSYTEYMRRKAAAAPKIIDTTIRSDASTITMRRRLQANSEFFTSSRQGVINNVSDPSGTGTTSLTKATTVTTKLNGGRIPDASLYTAFVGGTAINNDGGVFQTPRRVLTNSNDAGSISPCVTLDEPAPYLTQGTLVTTTDTSINQLSASGTTLTIGYSPYTIPGRNKSVAPKTGGTIVVSGARSTITLTGFTNTAGTVVATTTSTAGIQNGTVVTITGGTASAGNLGIFVVTSFVANTSITYANASGVTEVRVATATFTSPNNGTYSIVSVVSPTQVTVTNANAITDVGLNGTATISLYATGAYSSNTVPRLASNAIRDREFCTQPSTEPHIQNELGGSLFVDDTIRLKHLTSCSVNNNDIGQAIHTHPANIPHNDYQARPVKGQGGIPVFTISTADDARKVGSYNFPRNRHVYVEKHHGNDLNVNPRQLIKKYQIPDGSPAHLKINEPNHYPVA